MGQFSMEISGYAGSVLSGNQQSSSGAIELEIGGTLVRIASGADAATIAAVIQAVKAQS